MPVKEKNVVDVENDVKEVKEKSPKSLIVDIDTNTEDMLKYEEKGYELFFETAVGKFKKLMPKDIKKLKRDNQTRYYVASGQHQQNVDESDDPFSGMDIQVDSKAYSATEALEVEGKDPNFNYAWKSPEKLQRAAREGFVPVRDPDIKTAVGGGSEVRKIGAYGKDELILCKQPKELHEKMIREQAERSASLEASTYQQGINEIDSVGKSYVPPSDRSDDARFTLANPERAERR